MSRLFVINHYSFPSLFNKSLFKQFMKLEGKLFRSINLVINHYFAFVRILQTNKVVTQDCRPKARADTVIDKYHLLLKAPRSATARLIIIPKMVLNIEGFVCSMVTPAFRYRFTPVIRQRIKPAFPACPFCPNTKIK